MPVIHRARLCKICRWEDYRGYGFSLHATRGKVGHYIGDVDPRSPAFAGGIRDNDFLVEVNGINVLSDPHQQVVDRIKQLPDHVTLLVIDKDARKYFEEQHVVVDSYMESLERIDCPASNPNALPGHLISKEDNPDKIAPTKWNSVNREKPNHELEETRKSEIEAYILTCTEDKEQTLIYNSVSKTNTVKEIKHTQQPEAVCENESAQEAHVQTPSDSVVDHQVLKSSLEFEVINNSPQTPSEEQQQSGQKRDKCEHTGNSIVQEHVTEELRSSTRIEIIRESQSPGATKVETSHERTIIVRHDSFEEESQLRDAIERIDLVSSHEQDTNGPISPPSETRRSVSSHENGYQSAPNVVHIKAAPELARREKDRTSDHETVQLSAESTKSNEHKSRTTVKSAILEERPSSLAKSDVSRNASTLDSRSPSSETTNGSTFNQDLISVKMKCTSRGRKNRLPASTFAERKKMFDQL